MLSDLHRSDRSHRWSKLPDCHASSRGSIPNTDGRLIGHFTLIGSDHRSDANHINALTSNNTGTSFLYSTLTNCSPKKAQDTRCLEVISVNPCCGRPVFFHFKIGVRHVLHINRKTHMLYGMIAITTFDVQLNKSRIRMEPDRAGNVGLIPVRFGHYMACFHGFHFTVRYVSNTFRTPLTHV